MVPWISLGLHSHVKSCGYVCCGVVQERRALLQVHAEKEAELAAAKELSTQQASQLQLAAARVAELQGQVEALTGQVVARADTVHINECTLSMCWHMCCRHTASYSVVLSNCQYESSVEQLMPCSVTGCSSNKHALCQWYRMSFSAAKVGLLNTVCH